MLQTGPLYDHWFCMGHEAPKKKTKHSVHSSLHKLDTSLKKPSFYNDIFALKEIDEVCLTSSFFVQAKMIYLGVIGSPTQVDTCWTHCDKTDLSNPLYNFEIVLMVKSHPPCALVRFSFMVCEYGTLFMSGNAGWEKRNKNLVPN